MVRVFRTALPEFCGLREFEWIGYPELRADMVQNLLGSHPRLTSLGSIGFHFDACGISAFKTLKKLTLRAEDDDGYADWSEITTVLNNNASTLKHLILGAYLHRQHSWDATFLSPTIHNLTHLDLVDTRISHTVLSRIAHAAGGVGGRLESLTLHGILEEPGKAAVIFGSDEVINGEHTFLPRLKSFRFLLVGQPQVITPPPPATQPPLPPTQQPYYNPYPPHQPPPPSSQTPPQQPYPHPQEHYDPTILHLYQTITRFLRGRTKLRKLDLGSCPWDLVSPILPGLTGLRVLGVRIGCLARGCATTSLGGGNMGGVDLGGCTSEMDVLVKSLPSEMGALRIEVGVSELPLVRCLSSCFCLNLANRAANSIFTLHSSRNSLPSLSSTFNYTHHNLRTIHPYRLRHLACSNTSPTIPNCTHIRSITRIIRDPHNSHNSHNNNLRITRSPLIRRRAINNLQLPVLVLEVADPNPARQRDETAPGLEQEQLGRRMGIMMLKVMKLTLLAVQVVKLVHHKLKELLQEGLHPRYLFNHRCHLHHPSSLSPHITITSNQRSFHNHTRTSMALFHRINTSLHLYLLSH